MLLKKGSQLGHIYENNPQVFKHTDMENVFRLPSTISRIRSSSIVFAALAVKTFRLYINLNWVLWGVLLSEFKYLVHACISCVHLLMLGLPLRMRLRTSFKF